MSTSPLSAAPADPLSRVLTVAAVSLALVCSACLAALLLLKWAGLPTWSGLTVIPWFCFPVAFLLFCGLLLRMIALRNRA